MLNINISIYLAAIKATFLSKLLTKLNIHALHEKNTNRIKRAKKKKSIVNEK